PELTTSQRRLVALAAGLASEPDLLLVDELAAGAGTEELERIAHVLARTRERGVAVLLVEHSLRLVRLAADRVLVLAAGRPVAGASVAEVAASAVVRQTYLGTQRLKAHQPCAGSFFFSCASPCSRPAAARARARPAGRSSSPSMSR